MQRSCVRIEPGEAAAVINWRNADCPAEGLRQEARERRLGFVQVGEHYAANRRVGGACQDDDKGQWVGRDGVCRVAVEIDSCIARDGSRAKPMGDVLLKNHISFTRQSPPNAAMPPATLAMSRKAM